MRVLAHAVLEGDFFHERVSEPLDRAALELALSARAVDHAAGVVARHEPTHAGPAGLLVDLDFDGVRAEGVVVERLALSGEGVDRRRRRRVVLLQRLDGPALGDRRLHDARQRERAIGRAAHERATVGQHDVTGGGLQKRGRRRAQMAADFARRVEHRVARHQKLARRGGRARARREMAVTSDGGHPLDVETQHLGGDGAERRGLSPAHVGRGATDDGGAVQLHADPGTRRVARPAHPAVRRERRGHRAAEACRPAARPALAEPGPRASHRLGEQRLGLEHLARGERVALAEKVFLAQRERVDAERRGEGVHLSFVGEAGLDGAEAPVGARHRVVRVDRRCLHPDVRDPVWPRRGHQAVEQDPRRERCVGTGVGDELGLERGERAVARGAGAIAHDVGVALAVADERFLAGEHELNGPPRLPDQEAQQTLDGDVFLAAEAATDVRALEPDARVRKLEHLCHVAEVLEHLGAHAQGQHALGVDPADPGLGLEVDVVDERSAIGLLDDHVGSREAFGDVTRAQMPAAKHVAAFVDHRRVGSERRERVVDSRELLVLDLDEVRGLSRDFRRVGGDGRHRLALEAHAVVGRGAPSGARCAARPSR